MPTMPRDFIPLTAPYSHNGPGGALRTPVAGGAARYGLDYDRGVQQYQCTLLLDTFKYAVWVTFYHRVIAQGTISFDMLLDSGYGRQTHSVNIVPNSYNSAITGGKFHVITFVVEAESTAYDLSDAEVASLMAFYDIYGSDNALFDRIAQFATVDSLVLDF